MKKVLTAALALALALAAALTACGGGTGASEEAATVTVTEAVATPSPPTCIDRERFVALSRELQQSMTDFDEASHNAEILAEIAATIEPVYPDVAALYMDASDAYVAVDEAANVKPMTPEALVEASSKLSDAAQASATAVTALSRTVTSADWC